MKTPQSVLERRLGKFRLLSVRNEEIDLLKEVSIPDAADLDQLLHDHVERNLTWKLLLVRARAKHESLKEELDELRSIRFHHYWHARELEEREELRQCLHDEDAPRDAFRRQQATSRKVTHGNPRAMGRWRKNFSDDYIWACVGNDEVVLGKRSEVRDARERLDILAAVVDAMEHRMRCISHLCARDREPHA